MSHAARPHRRTEAGPWLLTAAAAVAGALLYLRAYSLHGMQPVGWDIFGYTWQTKAIGHAPLSGVGARPGMPLLASILRSVLPLTPSRELVVLPIVLAVALSLACAAAVRSALRLPSWFAALLVATTLVWPGTGRTLVGYEASLLLLVLLAAAVGILVQANGRPHRLVIAAALLLAAALSHIAIFAAFIAVTALFVVLSTRSFLRDRRAGVPLLATDAGAAVGGVGAAAAVGGAVLFGPLGIRPSDTLHTDAVSFLFRQRTFDEIHRIRPWATVPAAAVGAAAVGAGTGRGPEWLRAARSPAPPNADAKGLTDRPAHAIVRWGVAWLAVAAGGVVLSLAHFPVPGGRFLLFALPLPVLVAIGLGAVARFVAGGRLGVRTLIASILVVGVLAGLARQGYRFIQYQFVEVHSILGNELNAAASYVEGLPHETPVVVIVDQPGPLGAYSPKLRLSVIRAAMPADRILDTFVFVGRSEDLQAGRPTILPADRPWRQAYDRASRFAWTQVRPALSRGAAVLVLQRYSPEYRQLLAADPSRHVANGVLALRGPVRTVTPPPRAAPISAPAAGVAGLWLLVVLGVTGWGLTSAALPRDRASPLDVACLAAALGAGVAVLAGFAIAVLGGDPAGPAGWVALLLVAVGGAIAARRWRRADRPAPTDGADEDRGAASGGDRAMIGSALPSDPGSHA